MVVGVAGLTVLVDQLSKWWAGRALGLGEPRPLALPWVQLTLVHNTGAAFGLFQRWTWIFVAVSLVTCGIILWSLRQERRGSPSIALALILGGAVGNLIDRVVRGYVVDFIDLRVWPVFNVADSAITIGVAMILWGMLKGAPPAPEGGCGNGR